MCGRTVLTREIITKRIEELNIKIKEYTDSLISNKFLTEFEKFKNQKFHSGLFTRFQKSLIRANKSELVLVLSKIGRELNQININQLKTNAFNCIIGKVLEDNEIKSLLSSRITLLEESKVLAKLNQQVINQETINNFTENLKQLQFKYFDKAQIKLDPSQNSIRIIFDNFDIGEMFREVLSESEKSILSFSLF